MDGLLQNDPTRVHRASGDVTLHAPDHEEPLPGSARDPGALTEHDVLHCIPGLRALLLRLTRNPDTVNDLAQEVVLAVILAVRANRLREPAALAAYVRQTARNMVMMQGRKAQPVLMDELPEQEDLWGDRPRTPLEDCEAREMRELAHSVLADLPTERDRELVTGFYVEGRSKPELMQRFGLSKDQFDRVMWRARGRMRDLLTARLNDGQRSLGGHASTRICSSSDFEAQP